MSGPIIDLLNEKLSKFWNETVLGVSLDAGSQPAPVEHTDQLVSYGLHNILKYDQYDPDTGLFYNDNSVSFCFEVIPQTGADDNMVSRLNTLFTPIPPHFGIQWCLFGNPIVDSHYQAYLDQRHIAVDNDRTPPFFLELANRRLDYIRRSRGRPLWPNDNYVVKTTRLLFSVTKSGSHKNKKLIDEMWELRETLKSSLKTACLPSYPIDPDGLISFLWPILNPESMFDTDPFFPIRYDEGRSIKEQVTNFGQHARVKATEMLFGLPPESEGQDDERIAMRAFGVLQYPKKKELWEMANIIGSFYDEGLQYPCPFLICGGVFTLDPNVVDAKSKIKAARTKQNAKSKMAEYQHELSEQANDWDIVLHQLDDGGNLCELYHTLLLFSPKKHINRASQIAINVWRNERFALCPLNMLQLPALYASLPMTFTEKVREDLRALRLITTKTTVNATDLAPVLGEWRGYGDPVMMFLGRRGTPSFLDLYANKQGNYNAFVTGTSGSGKSVLMNEIVSSYRSIGAKVWVIDVGRSYRNIIALQKGTFLEFSPRTDLCINPFSWVGTDDELKFKDEMRLLKPMIGRMASPNEPLSEFQYSLISEAITAVWNDYGQDTNPTRIRDYLLSNIKNERGSIERVAFELAKQLQPFTAEGMYGGFFNGKANISLDSDMIGLELEELKSAPELRRVVLFVLTSRIANDMYLDRSRKKLCLLDEAWQLLGSDKETAEFIEEGYRRARKYNGIFCVGTQGIEDAFKNDASRAAFNNADWKIYLRQDQKNFQKLIDDGTVSFTPAIQRMIMSLRKEDGKFSELLVSSPNGDALLRHIPDPFTLLMASSNSTEFNECENLLNQGYSTMEALTIMLERRGEYA